MNQKGQAAILIVFVLGMIAVLIGISLTQTGFFESVMGRATAASAQAFYAANSGVEEAFYKVQTIDLYGVDEPATFELAVGESSAKVKVSGTQDQRTIESVGVNGSFVRKIKTEIQNTSLKPGFEHAIQADQGGVELRNNTQITASGEASGNVYSNSFIKGAKNDYFAASGECKNSASTIEGSAWAVERIDKLAENDSGVCIKKDAYSGSLDFCFVNGVPNSPSPPAASCPSANLWVNASAPEPVPLPDMGVDALKNYLTSRGSVFEGDCTLDGSASPADCSQGTNTIGELIITGNLRKPSNVNIFVSGPVWVKGNIIFDSLGSISPSAQITEISQIIVADGTIKSDSNVAFASNGKAFLLFISTFVPDTVELCEIPAITLASNTNSVLFYAPNGCLEVTANSTFHGAILGERILVDNNSVVEYDPTLQSAIFGLTKTGGWQTISFKEE